MISGDGVKCQSKPGAAIRLVGPDFSFSDHSHSNTSNAKLSEVHTSGSLLIAEGPQ